MDYFIDKICLVKLLALTFAHRKEYLLQLLVDNEMGRQERMLLVMRESTSEQLVARVERLKMQRFWVC